jgi:hypothetical protein
VSGKRQCAALPVMIMLGDMSTDNLSRSNAQTDDHPPAARAPLLRRPWVAPLALLTVIFIAYAVPPYLSLDPAQARIQPMPPHSSYYPLLVTHILLGSAALLAACLQVWPWLRQTHRAIHRWSGRIYSTAALPASVCVMIISPMGLRQSTRGQHDAGGAVVRHDAGRLPSDPAAALCRPPGLDAAERCLGLLHRGQQALADDCLRRLCAGNLYWCRG